MSRNLLHISKIEEFKAWLDKMALQHRPGRGDYQVLQVKNPTGPEWFCVFYRHNMPEHYTVDQRLEALVRQFIKSEKETKQYTCYQCEQPTNWLAPDSRCGKCTRYTPEEIRGDVPVHDEDGPGHEDGPEFEGWAERSGGTKDGLSSD